MITSNPQIPRRRLTLALGLGAGLLLAACSSSTGAGTTSSSGTSSSTTGTASSSTSAGSGAASGVTSAGSGGAGSSGASTLSGSLTIYAAASLKKTFDQLKTEFVKENPGVTVADITYDGSSVLATQLIGGAPADVFASADDANMTKVKTANLLAGDPQEFASNTLEIAVAPGNPKKITGLKDLTASGTTVVLCDVKQPCGAAAQKALTAAGITVKPVSEEQSVTAVVTKITSKDADAGLVYKTDVLANSGKIEGVEFPEANKAVNHYPVAALKSAKNPAAAAAFIALVESPTGQQILAKAGFGQG